MEYKFINEKDLRELILLDELKRLDAAESFYHEAYQEKLLNYINNLIKKEIKILLETFYDEVDVTYSEYKELDFYTKLQVDDELYEELDTIIFDYITSKKRVEFK